jgi:hypothetical protein
VKECAHSAGDHSWLEAIVPRMLRHECSIFWCQMSMAARYRSVVCERASQYGLFLDSRSRNSPFAVALVQLLQRQASRSATFFVLFETT